MLNKYYEEKYDALFDELVPAEGFAETSAGELLRAVSRICYRFWNDGDMIGVDYGNETCNPAARFIMEQYDGTDMGRLVKSLWGNENSALYERGLEMLVERTVDYIEGHPNLKSEENDWDMLDFGEPSDKEWDEEEEYKVFEEPWAVYDPD